MMSPIANVILRAREFLAAFSAVGRYNVGHEE
jgi:hypothetical protein